MQRDARAFLWDAHSAAEAILEFVAGKTYKDYSGDRLLQSSVSSKSSAKRSINSAKSNRNGQSRFRMYRKSSPSAIC